MASVAVVGLSVLDVAVTSFAGKTTAPSPAQRVKIRAGSNKKEKTLSYYPPYKKILRENLPLSIASNDKWRLKDKDLEEKTKE